MGQVAMMRLELARFSQYGPSEVAQSEGAGAGWGFLGRLDIGGGRRRVGPRRGRDQSMSGWPQWKGDAGAALPVAARGMGG